MQAPLHPDEDQRLSALDAYDMIETPTESDFDDIVDLASRICETPVSLMSLLDKDRQWFKASVGTDTDSTPRQNAICGHTILQDDLLEIEDTLNDPRTWDNQLIVEEHGMRFYAGVQLRTPQGLPIGTLCVLDDKPRKLTEFQRTALRTLANQVMSQLELRRTLRNQEILRGEMDHRVKNSLQTVQSLIRIYASKVSDPVATEAFAAVDRRLTAVVALHRELHQSSAVTRVRMQPFLSGILAHLSQTCPENVRVSSKIADFELSSAEATAVAVVLSECVANAIKHAFPDNRAGEISISFQYEPDGSVRLSCADNGVGKTDTPSEVAAMTSLGQRIMDASAQQIAATLDREAQNDGYRVTMTFTPVATGRPA
ncbi:Two-component sensor histidine kinase, contains HisKA and HATPase domains [Loktanella sp. DSM 29012]|uniref:sensor histidine kinase n=1 Tax=Loktanella sp. DSM 29012 TaxID=1881056 RepID=UPI0008C91367|nr:histidine kinase dimerization/phosphoacceptor domain -containing protein [Loktanella sp. DSM 29012]SEQ42005.1 Two-component sensor histidine kinase, contains HisKA and HATPase domains [Loktanella sp. DSM 29012]